MLCHITKETTGLQRSSQMSLPGRAPHKGHTQAARLGWDRVPNRVGTSPAPTNTGHRRNNISANSQQLWGIHFVSVWIFFSFFLLLDVITTMIL